MYNCLLFKAKLIYFESMVLELSVYWGSPGKSGLMHIPGLHSWRSSGMCKTQELPRCSYSHRLINITQIGLFPYPSITELFLYCGSLFTYFRFTLLKLLVIYKITIINLCFSFFMFIKPKFWTRGTINSCYLPSVRLQ